MDQNQRVLMDSVEANNLGVGLLVQGKAQRALSHFSKAIELLECCVEKPSGGRTCSDLYSTAVVPVEIVGLKDSLPSIYIYNHALFIDYSVFGSPMVGFVEICATATFNSALAIHHMAMVRPVKENSKAAFRAYSICLTLLKNNAGLSSFLVALETVTKNNMSHVVLHTLAWPIVAWKLLSTLQKNLPVLRNHPSILKGHLGELILNIHTISSFVVAAAAVA